MRNEEPGERLAALERELAAVRSTFATNEPPKTATKKKRLLHIHGKPRTGTVTRKPKRRRLLWVITGLVVGMLGAMSAFLFWQASNRVTDPFTPSVRSSVSIPLYYPGKLPRGFHIDASSITQPQTDTVVYKASGSNQRNIYISEAAVPKKDFDFKNFYGNFNNIDHFSTPLGDATSGSVNGDQTNIASIVINNKTWIIINAGTSVPASELKLAVQHLVLSQ